MNRHGIAEVADGAAAVHFGLAVWPYDVLLRFGYDLPEHEHRWPGRWIDDRFEGAALDLRSAAAKLLIALPRMDEARARLRSDGRSLADVRRAVETAPLDVDLVLTYLRRLVDGLAAVVPCCFGAEGRAMAVDRGSIEAMADSAALRKLDETLAGLLDPPPAAARVLAPGFAAHSAEVYVVSGAAGERPALPRAAQAALHQSAARTLAAAASIDAALAEMCPWFDAVLARLQAVVCLRAEDGPDLQERWGEPDWSVLATSVPIAALRAHLPLIVPRGEL